VTEADTLFGSSSDPNLGFEDFQTANTVTIYGLEANSLYVFNIWAYDSYGNKASATEVVQLVTTDDNKRSKTVKFFGGQYMGTGSVGRSSNVNYSLPIFDFNLIESAVAIKNAFILFEGLYEAYANNVGSSTGYTLAFDSCLGAACTPNAFTGSGNITKVDSTVLSGGETESNQLRLLFDVTREVQLASYTGNGNILRGAVGYRINQYGGPIANFISYAQATLVVTYNYDPVGSDSYTNTVIYPLKSIDSSRQGTKSTSTVNNCVLNSTCPLFDYNMDIPEYNSDSGSSNLSQWFQMYMETNNNLLNDIRAAVNIQGTDIGSNVHVREAANSDQGNESAMIFTSVSGYLENTPQTLEYQASTTAGTPVHYLIGGEVYETYTASASAPIKTRTVSFPIGVLNNGNTTATTSTSTYFYFPENGTANGTVQVKEAWLRIISSNYINTAGYNTSVTTKIGNQATSTTKVYNYLQPATVIAPNFYIFHVFSATDRDELELANAISAKKITIAMKNNIANQNGTSIELMVTYAYTDDFKGYLANNILFGGQQETNGVARSTTTRTANFVAPELTGKTIRAGALQAFYLMSSASGAMGNSIITVDAKISTGIPSCINTFNMRPDSNNASAEYYSDIKSSLLTDNNQTYNACYSNNGGALAPQGAKMNGMLIYTYQWDDAAPTSTFNSAISRSDGSGIVDIGIKANDINNNNLRVKIEYATGTTCDFSDSGDPTLDATQANISADYGDPVIDNNYLYQIGTTTGWITTVVGENNINFDWLAKNNLDNQEGDYCLRITANDRGYDQITPATTTLVIDNKAPTAAGPLSFNKRGNDFITVNFNSASAEPYFKEYKIFYKVYDGTAVTEADFVLASSTDPNLHDILFHNIPTTTVSGLIASTTYSLAIWAYDHYGNKSSSTPVEIATNGAPTGSINSVAQKTDGSGTIDISINADDPNDDDTLSAKIEYVLGAGCDFNIPNKAMIDSNAINIQADHGTVIVDNFLDYQVGSAFGWIVTSPGENNVNFDWLALTDLNEGVDATYCIRATLNDGLTDQTIPPTQSLTIDTLDPTNPGGLTANYIDVNSVVLNFGDETTENHFKEYKIFYKAGTSGVLETDYVLASSSDVHLGDKFFNGFATTTIGGLEQDTDYVFNIWAYDDYGNKASGTAELTLKTKDIPTASFISAQQKTDGSGGVDIAMTVRENQGSDSRVKIQYVEGGECDFTSPNYPSLDETDENITATHGDPDIDNNYSYQIGTTTGWIITSAGVNTVNFDWLSKGNIALANGIYCLRIIANNQFIDQTVPATATLTIDNLNPLAPGNLSIAETKSNSVTLTFGDATFDTNFKEYKIFYKEGTDGVTEADLWHASSTDINLGEEDYGEAATTTISGLKINTQYVFNIWAYDKYGNKASATLEATTTTNFTPKAQNWRWYYDYYNLSVSLPVSLENTSPNTITDNNSLKLRMAINETAGIAGTNIKFRLQYSTFADFSDNVHFVGDIGSSSPWNYVDGGGDDNGTITGLVLSDTVQEGTFNEIGSSTNVYEHSPNTVVEYDFTIRNNGAEKSQVYYFRAYDNFNGLPVPLNTGETYPSLSTSEGNITYTVNGLEAGTTTEGVTTDIASAPNLLDFGNVTVNADKIGAHRFTVDTNAGNGYQLFAYERQPLSNSSGSLIQPVPGTNDAPDIWPALPNPSAYGYHTSDATLSGASPSRFLPDNTYSRFETNVREVSYSPISVQNETIDLVYRLEASVLQSAGSYETEVVYIIVPNF
jgi:hypothetical protein